MYMYICIYVYMYICIYVYMYIGIYMYICGERISKNFWWTKVWSRLWAILAQEPQLTHHDDAFLLLRGQLCFQLNRGLWQWLQLRKWGSSTRCRGTFVALLCRRQAIQERIWSSWGLGQMAGSVSFLGPASRTWARRFFRPDGKDGGAWGRKLKMTQVIDQSDDGEFVVQSEEVRAKWYQQSSKRPVVGRPRRRTQHQNRWAPWTSASTRRTSHRSWILVFVSLMDQKPWGRAGSGHMYSRPAGTSRRNCRDLRHLCSGVHHFEFCALHWWCWMQRL